MQITTYGKTAAPVPVIGQITVSDPVSPSNPSAPSNPTSPTPPPVNPGTPTTPPNPTTKLPSTMTGMPVVMDMLSPKTGSVFQAIHYNRVRKEYYVSQKGKGSNSFTESTYIARLDDKGKYLDQMKLVDAGHGTSMVIENYGTKHIVYVWLSLANQNNDYYRFAYKPGTYSFKDLPSRSKLPKFTTDYATYHVDWEGDLLMERRKNPDTTQVLRKRKLSEVLKGIDHVYGTITTEGEKTPQGWAAANDSAYILSGAYNGETLTPPELSYLDTYNWSTGTRVDRVNLQGLGLESDGDWKQSTHEPEGMNVYRDPTTKKVSLIVGITTGIFNDTSRHKYFIYRYSNIGDAP